MPDEPHCDDLYADPDGKLYRVLSIHPPYITARRRRGWAVTLMSEDEGRMHLVSLNLLKEGGFSQVMHPAA